MICTNKGCTRFGRKKKYICGKQLVTDTIKTANSRLVLCQVIVHHDHNLLIRDAIPVDNLVGMAGVGLREENKDPHRSACTRELYRRLG